MNENKDQYKPKAKCLVPMHMQTAQGAYSTTHVSDNLATNTQVSNLFLPLPTNCESGSLFFC